MSKIKEMAEKYGNNIESNYNIDMFDRGDIMDAYEDGVKAVLGEIKKYIQDATQEHEVGVIWISGLINLINNLEGKE